MPTLPPTEIISWNWAAPEHTISGFLPQGGASQALIQTITAISIPHPSQLTHWWWCYMLFTVQKHQCFTSISTIWEAKDQIASTQWEKVKMTHSYVWFLVRGKYERQHTGSLFSEWLGGWVACGVLLLETLYVVSDTERLLRWNKRVCVVTGNGGCFCTILKEQLSEFLNTPGTRWHVEK